MARPILVVKNIAEAPKRYAKVAAAARAAADGDPLGRKAVRAEFGIPFALQEIISDKPRARGAILATLKDGDRFDGQKLVRLLDRTPKLTGKEIVASVEKAIV